MKLTFPRVQVRTSTPNVRDVSFFHSDTSDALKASLASASGHSKEQAEETYDQRTANERKECAVHVAREYAQEVISNPGMTETTETNTAAVQPPADTNVKLAQFVGLIEEGSTLRSPKVLIGQVHSFLANGKVSLLWYKAYKNYFKKFDIPVEKRIIDSHRVFHRIFSFFFPPFLFIYS